MYNAYSDEIDLQLEVLQQRMASRVSDYDLIILRAIGAFSTPASETTLAAELPSETTYKRRYKDTRYQYPRFSGHQRERLVKLISGHFVKVVDGNPVRYTLTHRGKLALKRGGDK